MSCFLIVHSFDAHSNNQLCVSTFYNRVNIQNTFNVPTQLLTKRSPEGVAINSL